MISCSKPRHESIPPDTNQPRLTIIAPAKSEFYRTGDPLCFKGDVFDENSLCNVKLKLFSGNDLANPIIEYFYPVSERSFYVEQKTIIPASLSGDCILQFEATDYFNNRAVSILAFTCN